MRTQLVALATVLTLVSTSGCLTALKRSNSKRPVPPPAAAETRTAPVVCADFTEQLAERDAAIDSLEARNDRQHFELLEDRVRIETLEERLHAQQLMLEEAIQDVVRARAKQRSVESRAEAASEIAEAEIALKSLSGDPESSTDLKPARQLLTRAGEEFESHNFGGALYLATQAKNRIRALRTRDGNRDDPDRVAGETAFQVPVPLQVKARSNFREGPGTDFGVVQKFEAGTALTGYATKGSWVRARSADGGSGWIHNSLVKGG